MTEKTTRRAEANASGTRSLCGILAGIGELFGQLKCLNRPLLTRNLAGFAGLERRARPISGRVLKVGMRDHRISSCPPRSRWYEAPHGFAAFQTAFTRETPSVRSANQCYRRSGM